MVKSTKQEKKHWIENEKDLGNNDYVQFIIFLFAFTSLLIGFKHAILNEIGYKNIFLMVMGIITMVYQHVTNMSAIKYLKEKYKK